MKSFKEALLNRPKNIDVARIAAEEYINTNYKIEGKLTYEAVNGIYTVNCNGNVEAKNKNIDKLTNGFVWGEVKGTFDCFTCDNLMSLEGAPKEVGRDFNCNSCSNLKSLEGAPEKVGGDFDCGCCKNLKTLEGAPKKVGRNFRCDRCKNLESLEGAPKKVGGIFACYDCPNLKSFEGMPK